MDQFFTVGKNLWPSVDRFDPLLLTEKIQEPIFVLHESEDWSVETKEVEAVFEKIKSKNKQLKIFHGGDHGIMEVPRPMREEFLADVLDWFLKTLVE